MTLNIDEWINKCLQRLNQEYLMAHYNMLKMRTGKNMTCV